MARTVTMTKENTEGILDIIKECWAKGCNDKEACMIAGIDKKSLNRWLYGEGEDKKFLIEGLLEERELLRSNPSYMARSNVYKSLKKGNVETSKWYLERKEKDEFSTKATNEMEVNISSKSIEDKEKEMMEKLDALIKK